MENDRTLAEMRSTVHENIIPIGSRIKFIIIGVVIICIIDHSKIIVCLLTTTYMVGRIIIARIDHNIILAHLWILFVALFVINVVFKDILGV